ncbi:hypothetical protein [Hamadaea tsunoensis]|uniref:hypothetical protein n=1 Tax=Hamadaea tsunoensis TaxID=53368 RepID=UPI0003FED62E|nr:hypothetical protein [Hamadaea tsunoensis]
MTQTQEFLREVTGPDRTCQVSSTLTPDGRWDFSVVTCDNDGQIMTDLHGLIAPDDLDLILSALPGELITMSLWAGQPVTMPGAASLAERRKKHPKLFTKWTEADEDRLAARFRGGASYAELAAEFGRNVAGIKARLVKLGELTPEQGGWVARWPNPRPRDAGASGEADPAEPAEPAGR